MNLMNLTWSPEEKKECTCGGNCTCNHDNHEVANSVSIDAMQAVNKPFFSVTPINNTFSMIGNVFVSEQMMSQVVTNPEMDIDAIRAKIFKVSQALWAWEEKNNFSHQTYLMSGFDNANHFRVESVYAGHSGMNVNGIVVAMVTNDNLEISGIKAAGV